MKKVMLIIVCLCVIALVVLINLPSTINIIRLFSFLLIAGIVYGVISYFFYERFIKTRLPRILVNMQRNYKVLALGNEIACRKKGNFEKETLILTNFGRNMYTDYMLLQRYFSFLDHGGEVVFYFTGNNEHYINTKKISLLDYRLLHTVTLLEHSIDIRSKKYKALNFLIGYFFFWALITDFVISIQSNSSITELNENALIKEINDFCEKRGISVNYINTNKARLN